MNILRKNVITIGRLQHFISIAELNDKYCFFESSHTLASNFGLWLTLRPDAILHDSNQNLRWHDKEQAVSILQTRILTEQSAELKNELQKCLSLLDYATVKKWEVKK